MKVGERGERRGEGGEGKKLEGEAGRELLLVLVLVCVNVVWLQLWEEGRERGEENKANGLAKIKGQFRRGGGRGEVGDIGIDQICPIPPPPGSPLHIP